MDLTLRTGKEIRYELPHRFPRHERIIDRRVVAGRRALGNAHGNHVEKLPQAAGVADGWTGSVHWVASAPSEAKRIFNEAREQRVSKIVE
mgnify:FL=1